MGEKRTVTLRLEKTELIARLELQRAGIADTWREVSEPLVAIDDSVRGFSRHSKTFGGIAAAAGFMLLVTGKLHIFRKLLKVGVWVLPYLLSQRSKGMMGLVFTLAKKAVKRFL